MGGRRSTALDTIISIVYVEVNAYMRVEVTETKLTDLSKGYQDRFGVKRAAFYLNSGWFESEFKMQHM